MIFYVTVSGFVFGSLFKIIYILREHKERLNRIEDFISCNEVNKDEVDD